MVRRLRLISFWASDEEKAKIDNAKGKLSYREFALQQCEVRV